MKPASRRPRLVVAFPKSEAQLRVVFSGPVDQASAIVPSNYETRMGLTIRDARVDPDDPRRVSLETEPMNGEAMVIDQLRAPGVRTITGRPLAHAESPEFIQGLASIPEIQKAALPEFPFSSRYVGKVASASCGKDGGVDSNVLIDTFGFAFIHMETGGPFNSLKIVTKRHIPGIADATRILDPGQTVHVLWAGGVIRNVRGENRLVDTGYMEGSIIPPTPLQSPPPFPMGAAEFAKAASRSLRAKGFQGVIARFEDVTIDHVSEPGPTGLRTMRFHDKSGGQLPAVILGNVKISLQQGRRFRSLRGLVHQPRAGRYEIIVELDEHFV